MTQSNFSEIEAAAKTYTWEFTVQIVLVVVTALLLAYWSWRVWRAENRLQDIIKQDAEMRIADARVEAARANERTAALALKVEEEARKRAEAEERVALIRKQLGPRHLPPEFIDILKDKPKGEATIVYPQEDGEAHGFALQLFVSLQQAGWRVEVLEPINLAKHSKFSHDALAALGIPPIIAVGGQPTGISIVARRLPGFTEHVPFNSLSHALLTLGLPAGGGLDENLPDNFFRIIVGPKL